MTRQGQHMMLEKFENGDFGFCPRYYCRGTPLLPCGTCDEPGVDTVRMYCASCRDLYQPPSSRFNNLDGAFFGTSFAHVFVQAFPEIAKVPRDGFRVYEARMFGFRVAEKSVVGARMKWLRQRLDEKGRNVAVVAPIIPAGGAFPATLSASVRMQNQTSSAITNPIVNHTVVD